MIALTADEAWIAVDGMAGHPTIDRATIAAALVRWMWDTGGCPRPRGRLVATQSHVYAMCARVLATEHTSNVELVIE